MQVNTSPFSGAESSTAARWRRLTLALAFASVLGACGGGDGEPEVPPPAPSPAPAPTPAPAPSPAPAPLEPRLEPQWSSTLALTNKPQVSGVMTNGAPLTAPLERVAPASSLPDWRDERARRSMVLAPDASLISLDAEAMRVVRVMPDGEIRVQASAARPDGGAAQGFWRPTAFTTDAHGNAYVADGWYEESLNCAFLSCSGASHNPTGPGAWAGVWKVTPTGEQTRLTGVVAGDAYPDGPVDGDKNSARFGAISSMRVHADGNLYVVDHQRELYPRARPPRDEFMWKAYVIRRIAPDGAVTTITADQLPEPLIVTQSGRLAVNDPYRWRNSVDAAGNTWVMSQFTMYRPATGLQDPLHLFAVTRHGADGVMLPGSLLFHWGCSAEVESPDYKPSTCTVTQLGLAQGKLYGLVNGDLVRVDVQALLPK